MKVLVTGAAGFIGASLVERLISRGDEVVGLDSINSYYAPRLKLARLSRCGFILPASCLGDPGDGGLDAALPMGSRLGNSLSHSARFVRLPIDDRAGMEKLFEEEDGFDAVVNLAAQAGVRYSIANPYAYLDSNLAGFLVVLECCRNSGVKNLLFASSSSVYGMSGDVPYTEASVTDAPVSLYAATKKADELMAHAYCRLYGINMAGLRYFTVYGPWGRPDMAPMLFARAIMSGESIKVFNNGDLMRDFTYIDDIVEGTVRVLDRLVSGAGAGPGAEIGEPAYTIYNIGCSSPVRLMDFISELEDALGRKAGKVFLPMQPGDVYETFADVSRLVHDTGYRPSVALRNGIRSFAKWYLSEDNPLRADD